ncbi:hypothetical protein Q5752_003919 [Cryptotrichosporon argae]
MAPVTSAHTANSNGAIASTSSAIVELAPQTPERTVPTAAVATPIAIPGSNTATPTGPAGPAAVHAYAPPVHEPYAASLPPISTTQQPQQHAGYAFAPYTDDSHGPAAPVFPIGAHYDVNGSSGFAPAQSYPSSWPGSHYPGGAFELPHPGGYAYVMPAVHPHGNKQMEPILAPGEMPAPRPPQSYAALIGEALLLAPPPHQLYVSEISDSIKKRYPYYRQNPSKIYNGVRHQTSMCKAFVKLPRPFGDQSGGARKWAIRAGSESWFNNGGYNPPASAASSPAAHSGSSPVSERRSIVGGKAKATARAKQLAIGTSRAGASPHLRRGAPPRTEEPEYPTSAGPSNGPAWDPSRTPHPYAQPAVAAAAPIQQHGYAYGHPQSGYHLHVGAPHHSQHHAPHAQHSQHGQHVPHAYAQQQMYVPVPQMTYAYSGASGNGNGNGNGHGAYDRDAAAYRHPQDSYDYRPRAAVSPESAPSPPPYGNPAAQAQAHTSSPSSHYGSHASATADDE